MLFLYTINNFSVALQWTHKNYSVLITNMTS